MPRRVHSRQTHSPNHQRIDHGDCLASTTVAGQTGLPDAAAALTARLGWVARTRGKCAAATRLQGDPAVSGRGISVKNGVLVDPSRRSDSRPCRGKSFAGW